MEESEAVTNEVTVKESTFDDDKRVAYLSSGNEIHAVHRKVDCRTEFCPLHNPSEHEYRHLPLSYMAASFVRLDDSKAEPVIIDPDDRNYNTLPRVILRNSAKCYTCGVTVQSFHRHDRVRCDCGGITVSGGFIVFERVIGNEGANHVDTSLVFSKKK